MLSTMNVLILVTTLSALSMAGSQVIALMAARRGKGPSRGAGENETFFLSGSSARQRSVLGAWYLPLAAARFPETPGRRSRRGTRSPFSNAFGASPSSLPLLNDGERARRFWDAIGSKARS